MKRVSHHFKYAQGFLLRRGRGELFSINNVDSMIVSVNCSKITRAARYAYEGLIAA